MQNQKFKIGDKVKYVPGAMSIDQLCDAVGWWDNLFEQVTTEATDMKVRGIHTDRKSVFVEFTRNGEKDDMRIPIKCLQSLEKPRHPHADVMIAYANDTTLGIQWRTGDDQEWEDIEFPSFHPEFQYRIKPEEKYETRYQVLYKTKDYGYGLTSGYYRDKDNFDETNTMLQFVKLVEETAEKFVVV